jgi:hypothetical protein
MNADGSNQTRLTTDPAREFGAAWSPDGTKIAFLRSLPAERDVYILNADGSDQHAVHPEDSRSCPPGSRFRWRRAAEERPWNNRAGPQRTLIRPPRSRRIPFRERTQA